MSKSLKSRAVTRRNSYEGKELKMSSEKMAAMMKISQRRAEAYLHIAKTMMMNDFGPATEHTHTEVTVALATAMMQHEGAQIIADAFGSANSQ